jgi:N-methylhydantoinase B
MTVTRKTSLNAVELAVFSGRLDAICKEMGEVLQKSALSPNIKDRLDFSCAFFDKEGKIVAQAAHIPVHLGSMAFAMKHIVSAHSWFEGDTLVLNDPFMGGTHLPDVTLISPCFCGGTLMGFVANRAHHANIGCDSPGSMPLSEALSDEGVLISPIKLYERGVRQSHVVALLASVDKKECSSLLPGDFLAQVSSNRLGLKRLAEWLASAEVDLCYFQEGLRSINEYGSRLAMKSLAKIPNGIVHFSDFMDGDGFSAQAVKIQLSMAVQDGRFYFDFEGTSGQVRGNINCPMSVCAASVYYVFAGLLPDYVPHCDGVFGLLDIKAPEGCLVNARQGVAVSAGNVETSMRIVDVVLGCLSELGLSVPAASQGTMNNVAMGGEFEGKRWADSETFGGGGGAGPHWPGINAAQCHMTNTLNTPVESLEMHYPILIEKYGVRSGSGGLGEHSGGNGLERVYAFLAPVNVTLLTERRESSPWGLKEGMPGASGVNAFNSEGVGAKCVFNAGYGDVLALKTPGGGGWGSPRTNKEGKNT